jgi:hypothetical protein
MEELLTTKRMREIIQGGGEIADRIGKNKNKLLNDKGTLSDTEVNTLIAKVIKDTIELNGIKVGDKFTFTSPYEEYKEYIGKKGVVKEIITDENIVDWENAPLYLAKMEDGVEIHTHAEEIKPELIMSKSGSTYQGGGAENKLNQ